jgi:hypothetical protein
MRVTILFLALIVGGYTVDDGYPLVGYGLIAVAFWEATMQETWNKPGHWATVALRRGFISLFYALIGGLAVMARLNPPSS